MMSTTREKIEVMEAFERGEEIECRNVDDRHDEWVAASDLIWNWGFYDYRVKPKPLEGWMNVYEDGYWSLLHDTLEEATRCRRRAGRTVHMREVRDE